MSVKVSVIIPVYNVEQYLEECIESVLSQTLRDIEVICINDGSTDGSLKILEKYAKQDSRMIVKTVPNAGAGVARNVGMDIAQGEYYSILDSDDFFEPTMLETAYNAAKEHGDIDILIFGCNMYDHQKKIYSSAPWVLRKELLPPENPFNINIIPDRIFNIGNGWAWDKLFRSEFVKAHPELRFSATRTTNDMYFVFMAYALADTIYHIDDVLAHQRVNRPNSLSVTREKSWNNSYKALTELKENLEKDGLYDKLEQSFVNWSLDHLLWHYNTLKGDAKQEFYSNLKESWFEKLGVLKHIDDANYFYKRTQYDQLYEIVRGGIISVIVPVCNVEDYLEQCLDSILAQTYDKLEIICIDDGSKDSSGEILDRYKEQHPEIVVVHKQNGGYGAAINSGLDIASGEYIGIVEPDDFISEHMYEWLHNAVKLNPGVDVVKAGYYKYFDYEDGKTEEIETTPWNVRGGQVFTVYQHPEILRAHPSVWSAIYRNEFLKENGIRMVEAKGAGWVDNPFYYEVLYMAKSLCRVNRNVYYYRQTNPNASSNIKNCAVPIDRLNDILDFVDREETTSKLILRPIYWRACYYMRMIEDNEYLTDENKAAGTKMMQRLNPEIFLTMPREDTDTYIKWVGDEEKKAYITANSTNYTSERVAIQETDISAMQDGTCCVVPIYKQGEYLESYAISEDISDKLSVIMMTRDDKTVGAIDGALISHGYSLKAMDIAIAHDYDGEAVTLDKVVAAYRELSEKLRTAGQYERFERTLINSLMFDMMYKLSDTESREEYGDALHYMKYSLDSEYGASNHTPDYYYNPEWLIRFYEYKKGVPSEKVRTVRSDSPKVSVVIPSLNSKKYYRECIESVLEQTLTDIEVICVDAGSDDGTVDIIEEYAASDARVSYIKSDMRSYGHQVNLGIKAARGKYIGIVESDDYIVPEMYAELYEKAETYSVDIIKANFCKFMGEQGQYEFEEVRIVDNDKFYNKVINPADDFEVFKSRIVPWSGLYKTSFMRDKGIYLNETPGASYQDNGLWFQCMAFTRKLYFSDKHYYCLRRDNEESSFYSKGKVYCMCDEYDFIREKLHTDEAVNRRFAGLAAYYRYMNYMFTLDRISEEYKPEFVERFSRDLHILSDAGELKREYFRADQWDKVILIMEDPEEYYYSMRPVTYDFMRTAKPERYEQVLKRWFDQRGDEKLDLTDPRTFNQKLQWLKLYENTDKKRRLADKCEALRYGVETIGEKHVIKTYGEWDSFDDIDFDSLPDSFVLKIRHGRGCKQMVEYKGAIDIESMRETFDTWLGTNYGVAGLELAYRDVKPGIYAEEYLGDDYAPYIYRVMCFGGKAKYVLCNPRKGGGRVFYDTKWEKQEFTYNGSVSGDKVDKPVCLDEMLRMAEKLSADISFCQIKFYVSDDGNPVYDGIVYGLADGAVKWVPVDMGKLLGDMIDLPAERTDLGTQSFADMGVGEIPRKLTKEDFAVNSEDKVITQLREENKRLRDELRVEQASKRAMQREMNRARGRLNSVEHSASFRIGRKITAPYRKVRDKVKGKK